MTFEARHQWSGRRFAYTVLALLLSVPTLAPWAIAAGAEQSPASGCAVLDAPCGVRPLIQTGYEALGRWQWPDARKAFRAALARLDGEAAGSPEAAAALAGMGRVELLSSDHKWARGYLEQALEVVRTAAPGSILEGAILNDLAKVALLSDDPQVADQYLPRALSVLDREAPQSLELLSTLRQLAFVSCRLGRLPLADSYDRRALSLAERLPGRPETATILAHIAFVAEKRGDFTAARDLYSRTLEAEEARPSNGGAVAAILGARAWAAVQAGDPEAARHDLARVLAFQEQTSAAKLEILATLDGLALVAGTQGRESDRREYVLRAKESLDSLTPGDMTRRIAVLRFDMRGTEIAEYQRHVAAVRQRSAPNSLALAVVLNELAIRNPKEYERLLPIWQKAAPDSVAVAFTAAKIGRMAVLERANDVAEGHYRRALVVLEQRAPRDGLRAATAFELSGLEYAQGNVAAARATVDAVVHGWPASETSGLVAAAESLGELGAALGREGDLASAERFLQQQLRVLDRIAPDSRSRWAPLRSLGLIALDRGDLAAAEDYQQQALASAGRHLPGFGDAMTLRDLAWIALARGDLDAAEAYGRQALVIDEKGPPDLGQPADLNLLGVIALRRGEIEQGEDFLRRSYQAARRTRAGSGDLAAALNNIGTAYRRRGDLASAERVYRESLALEERLGPDSLSVANTLANLGLNAEDRDELEAAAMLHQRALAIREKRAPGTLVVAKSLNRLGNLAMRQGQRNAATDLMCRAVDVLEQQAARLGGADEARAGFGAEWAFMYRDCEEALLGAGKVDDAFAVVERSRARSLLQMLAERELLFTNEVPPGLDRERRMANAAYDRALQSLGRLSPVDDREEFDEAGRRLTELQQRQREIAERIKKASPRLAALQYPEALGLLGVQGALDPGTVYLSFSVGKAASSLYIVESQDLGSAVSGLTVVSLPIGDADLRAKVQAFRALISGGGQQDRGVRLTDRSPDSAGTSAASRGLALELYRLLIAPAEKQIGAAVRVLISPDGPLHALPFSALIRTGDGDREEYFIEWKPLHVVVSATVYAELNKARRRTDPGDGTGPSLVAFGDPEYPSLRREDSEKLGDVQVRHAVRGGVSLSPLPFTRHEVDEIAGLYGARGRRIVGGEATERAAKAIGVGTDYVHFACHGILDEQFPLNSALALSIPEAPREGQDNGLLQAWEIFEGVRMNVDLVVLSACETGLGKELGGEGLIGLTRAFQYAGARTVVASLWSVADESTAGLMKEFYVALKAGRPKDEALRQAQLALLRDPRTASPFHWAAFQVVGDWQ